MHFWHLCELQWEVTHFIVVFTFLSLQNDQSTGEIKVIGGDDLSTLTGKVKCLGSSSIVTKTILVETVINIYK